MATDNNHTIQLPAMERRLNEARAQEAWLMNQRLAVAGKCLAAILGRSDKVQPEFAAARAVEAADKLLERALGVKINERPRPEGADG